MYSELECGVCYLTYNAGRRCPRELRCGHTFCESCLLALSRPAEGSPEAAKPSIPCPLCRFSTSVSHRGNIRSEIRVDECVLTRLMETGVLEQEEEGEGEETGETPEEEEEAEEERPALPETHAEDGGSSAGSRGGRLRRSWRKVWKVISGKSLQQQDQNNCLSEDDMRNLAMMSCYMF